MLLSEQQDIIREWEKHHRPGRSRSRLADYDDLISEKIEQGYTQQSVAALLTALGCPTTHQNLSKYLRKKGRRPADGANKQEANSSASATGSAISRIRHRLQEE